MNKPIIRLLIIEDTAIQMKTIGHMLESSTRFEFVTDWATNLVDGLKLLSEKEFDVILSDLQLHDSYGVGTLHRLQNQAQSKPIVLLTNIEDEVLEREALSSGAQDYLIKSQIDPKGLIRALDHAIERHRLFAEMQRSYEARIAELGG